MEEDNSVSIVGSIGRSLSRASRSLGLEEDVFSGSHHRRSSHHSVEDEEALRWAALEKLSTYNRLRTTIFNPYVLPQDQQEMPRDKMLLDVRELDPNAHQQFIDSVFKVAEDDNGKFLKKLRDRVDRSALVCSL